MSENINNNQSDNKTEPVSPTSNHSPAINANDLTEPNPSWLHFEAQVLNRSINSVTIEWSAFDGAVVYKIEKFHKRRGWQQVEWSSSSPITIFNLEENFSCRLRIIALHLAAEGTHYEVLAVSPDVIAITEAALPSTNCLHRAIRKGQQFLVKRMLRRRPSLIDYPGPNGFLPLANAITQGEMCIIDVLLSAGCSVHVGNPSCHTTPLHLAFYHGHLQSARILLNKKAQLEAVDFNGMTPAHSAVDGNQLEMLKFALESGSNLEARDRCGWTLLLRAVVMNADLELVKLLVTHGADLAAIDDLGKNCCDLARLYKRTEAGDYFEKVHTFRQMKLKVTRATKPTDL
ncbi:fibronectin type 3 and ankyrin repeat domains protein 1 [Scaptodrosophila lebanonensis]|uniref:Fibronectin type 3 and ankyrin repeat domains protein 1 n=1 Tax=Drosophila lebanonensis TaxID=7225 RepID=A0A6J2T660_DROLE|nr:fibronectin type 3 and ankyrin repeat domains protein 1 [Scaptodrosophila lebanonensis]